MLQNIAAPEAPLEEHPFRKVLSLDLLLDFWRQEAASETAVWSPMARQLMAEVERHPELQGALPNREVLTRHSDLLKGLMSAVIPRALKNLACAGAAVPASFEFFHTTPRFERELLGPDGTLQGNFFLDELQWDYLRALYCYIAILRAHYGVDVGFQKSVIVELTDPTTRLNRYYQLRAQFDMMRIRPVGRPPELPYNVEAVLAPGLTDLELWRSLIPPEAFEFYGFVVYEATDLTEEMVLSAIKQELVERDPLMSRQRFMSIQQRMRNLLGLPDLSATVIGLEGDQAFRVTSCEGILHGEGLHDVRQLLSQDCRKALYHEQPVLIDDLDNAELCSPLMEQFRVRGARSFLMAPLTLDDELLGVLILTSATVRSLNALTRIRIQGTLPLFALAVRRTTESLHNRIQAIMKERFTAIHPAVEWRFRKAASCYLKGEGAEEEIAFPDVYPLFATSDIRSSSTLRNSTVQEDLTRQLELAGEVLTTAHRERPLSYLESREFRVDKWVNRLTKGLDSGDEARVIEFLKAEIEPLFPSLESYSPLVKKQVDSYRKSLDPRLGILYDRRKSFEDSLNLITDHMAAILLEEQRRAQEIFPHYFEMHKTDGVDHTIYVGASMAERGGFDPLYVKNLRLWQLQVVCRLAQEEARLSPTLPMPLTTAHLVLAQRDPISLRYSQEEMKFVVDGAYNARYEIIKKRIDKANVHGTGERLTQPGKIAIVYSHPGEAAEYREYLEFLQAKGLLAPEIEELELERLQGVQGLKALRVTVRQESSPQQSNPQPDAVR